MIFTGFFPYFSCPRGYHESQGLPGWLRLDLDLHRLCAVQSVTISGAISAGELVGVQGSSELYWLVTGTMEFSWLIYGESMVIFMVQSGFAVHQT